MLSSSGDKPSLLGAPERSSTLACFARVWSNTIKTLCHLKDCRTAGLFTDPPDQLLKAKPISEIPVMRSLDQVPGFTTCAMYDAPSQKKHHTCYGVCCYKGTLKQFFKKSTHRKFSQNYEHHTVAQRKEGKPSLHKHTMSDIKTFEGNWPAQLTQ